MLTRRALLGGLALGAAGIAASPAIPAGLPSLTPPVMGRGVEWRLAFRNVHTNESVDAVFARSGQFVSSGLAELNHGLRDWRTGETMAMDRRLLALLVRLRDTLDVGAGRKIDLISGYRSPHTNAALRTAGGEHTGVASQSQHMLGRATDIFVPGVSIDRLHGAALALGGGGVGFYPRDGFVHVDSGAVRHWGG